MRDPVMKQLPIRNHKLHLENGSVELYCSEMDIEIQLDIGVTDKSYNELVPDMFCCVIVTRAEGSEVTGYTFAFNNSLDFEREMSRILQLLGVKSLFNDPLDFEQEISRITQLLGVKSFRALVSLNTNDLLR